MNVLANPIAFKKKGSFHLAVLEPWAPGQKPNSPAGKGAGRGPEAVEGELRGPAEPSVLLSPLGKQGGV